METSSNSAQELPLDYVIDDLNRILAELDKRNLQLPAIHIATAIDCIEDQAC